MCVKSGSTNTLSFFVLIFTEKDSVQKWLVQSRLLVNPPEARLPESSSPPRQQERVHQQQEESRSHTDTGQEPLL